MANLAFSSSSYSDSNPYSQFGFTTPSALDWLKGYTYKPSKGLIPSSVYEPASTVNQTFSPTVDAVPSEVKNKEELDFERILKLQQMGAKTSADLTRQQIRDLYPYLSAASADATARNLAASTQFLLTKEQTPTAQAFRNQIAQGQIATSANAEAARDVATADQWLKAGQGPGKYVGTMFRMA